MNKYFINKYLKNITKKDIYNIAVKYNIILNNNEVDRIYKYIQKHYNEYYKNNIPIEHILKESKDILTDKNYNKLISLYNRYIDKI